MINSNQTSSPIKSSSKGVYKDTKFDINFKDMKVIKPEKGYLRRKWYPGLAIQYRTSINMMSLKCCIYKIQVKKNISELVIDEIFPI